MRDNRLTASALFVATIVATGSIAINAAIPGAPDIDRAFDLTHGTATGMVGVFVVGYAIGHVLVGLFVHALPQKSVLLFGLLGFIACSLLLSIIDDRTAFVWLRGSQGLFASACPIIGRALVRQLGNSRLAAKRMSAASAIFTWAPVVAPVLAASVADQFGWRAVYLLLAVYAALGAAWVATTPANRFAIPSADFSGGERVRALAELSTDPYGRTGLVVGSLVFAAFFAFLAVAPVVYLGWQPAPVALAVVVSLYSGGYAIGAAVSRVLLNMTDATRVLQLSTLLLVVSGFAQALTLFLSLGTKAFFFFAVLCAIASGAAMPNATTLTIQPATRLAPLSLALLGMVKVSLAALTTIVASWVNIDAKAYVCIVVLFCGITALVVVAPIRRVVGQSSPS